MPYQEADETDPMLLVGVELAAGEEAARESANAIAQEYARMGFDEPRLMELFTNPFYGGSHQTFLLLGAEKIRAIVKEQVAFWSRVCCRDRDTDPETGLGLLNVLQDERRKTP